MKRTDSILSWLLSGILLVILSTGQLQAQSTKPVGGIFGKVTDKTTGEVLPGATILIKGTTDGTVSDTYGDYDFIIPVGKQTLVVRFLGYKQLEITVEIEEKVFQEVELALEPDAIVSEEIVVTGQALGQLAAINQQINSNTIVNVVSKDRIRSLPDQNAAESVGRLPGIAIRRNAGEAQEVVIRGLSPRFSSITVNGERIPSTDASNRSVDLSIISTDALEGIEVFKALTPDKDGDAVGGTVNFVSKKADENWEGSFRYLHGYNGLENEFGQHRLNGNIGNRFLNNKLGVILGGNYQRVNRSSEVLVIDRAFDQLDAQTGENILLVTDVNLTDRVETRFRYGINTTIDYRLKNGGIALNAIWSRNDRDETRRRRRFRASSSRLEYDIRDREVDRSLASVNLEGNIKTFKKLDISWRSSYSQSRQTTPFNHDARFRDQGAIDGALIVDTNDAQDIINATRNDLGLTFFQSSRLDDDEISTENITAQIDLKYPLDLGDKISGYIKGGGKVRDVNRMRDIQRLQARFDAIESVAIDNPGRFVTTAGGQPTISNFLGNYEAENFLDGEFFLGPGDGSVNGPGLSEVLLNNFLDEFLLDYYSRDALVDGGDYTGDETITAAYLMSELNFGKKLTMLLGARYENTSIEYTGGIIAGSVSASEIEIGDDPRQFIDEVTESRSYGELLPSFHLKYKVNDNFDVRSAVTRSLNRPDFINLVPFQRINSDDDEIEQGNFDLQHQTAWNYDVFLSYYKGFGLVTLGGFYKSLNDVDFIRESTIVDDPEFSQAVQGFDLRRPENAIGTTEVYGVEIDVQVRTSFLPSPLDGFVLAANASFIDSRTFVPFRIEERQGNELRVINTERETNLIGQVNRIYNLSLGYEKGGFSARFSLLYQGEALGNLAGGSGSTRPGGFQTEINQDPTQDRFTREFTRLDFSVKQKVVEGLTIFFNGNNLNNQQDRSRFGEGSERFREEFGSSYDLGIQYRFK